MDCRLDYIFKSVLRGGSRGYGSNTAYHDISQQISMIQRATGETVAAIERIAGVIAQIDRSAMAVSSSVEEQGATTSEISRSINEAASGTVQVSRAMGAVASSATISARSAETMLNSVVRVDEQAQKVATAAKAFLERVRKL